MNIGKIKQEDIMVYINYIKSTHLLNRSNIQIRFIKWPTFIREFSIQSQDNGNNANNDYKIIT